MGMILDQGRPEVHAMAREIMEQHHPELKMGDEYPTICIMMASSDQQGEKKEPPLKKDGYPCAAIVKVIAYDQRVDNRRDAEIKIDEELWNDLTEPQQRALLDHEITHLEIQKDESGCVKTDDAGRPKLKLRLHDYQMGGFRCIAKRYGSDALEVIEARKFDKEYGDDLLMREALFAQ